MHSSMCSAHSLTASHSIWATCMVVGGMACGGHAWWGHVWQGHGSWGSMHGWGMLGRGACVVVGDMHGRGDAWQGACMAHMPPPVNRMTDRQV